MTEGKPKCFGFMYYSQLFCDIPTNKCEFEEECRKKSLENWKEEELYNRVVLEAEE